MAEDWKHVYRSSEFAERYARKRATGASSRRREAAEAAVVERALARADLPRSARALDCPAGTGRFSELLSSRGFRVTSSDIALAMLARASGGTPRVVADAQRLPFPDASFELVLCVRLLHHVPTREGRRAILAELSRVSSRFVLASFFHVVSYHELRDRLFAIVRPFEKTRHATTLAALAEDARASGLEVAESFPLLRYVKRHWFVLFRRVREVGR
ncbi:class I SAM-dependent methyltransferase [bacterium]|nr:class I SAM-dependent methyltransferase [bacterium]